jgi:predicted transcriptional regulator
MKMDQIIFNTLEHLKEDPTAATPRSELFETFLKGVQEIEDDQLVKEALERVMAIESLAELERILEKSTLPRA